jgi:resuscitation-promoting factor RpfA
MSGERRIVRFLLVAVAAAIMSASAQLLLAAPASADPPAADWQTLRRCESGGDYTIVATHGDYYGAYQFDLPTWRSVGGRGYPHQATPREQDYRALYLYRMRGWQPWTCASIHGLREDADARSERVPTYAESAYLADPSATPATATTTAPPWPGIVFDQGDCHPALRTWQLRMNTHGFAFQGTGCYHAETRHAVLALQRANGIKASGLLGPKTWDAAWEGTPASP